MEKYVTLEYLPQDEELAKQLADILEDKHVECHLFEKVSPKDPAVLADLKNSSCLIILHVSEDYDYRDYLKEMNKADGRCQVVAVYVTKSTYQNRYSINEIEVREGYELDYLANDICCIKTRAKSTNDSILIYFKNNSSYEILSANK